MSSEEHRRQSLAKVVQLRINILKIEMVNSLRDKSNQIMTTKGLYKIGIFSFGSTAVKAAHHLESKLELKVF